MFRYIFSHGINITLAVIFFLLLFPKIVYSQSFFEDPKIVYSQSFFEENKINLNNNGITTNKDQSNLEILVSEKLENMEKEKIHRVEFFLSFLFGSSGDEVFSGLYTAPVGIGGGLNYIYDDNFKRFLVSAVGHWGVLLSPYEKRNPGYDELNEYINHSLFYFSSTFLVWRNEKMAFKIGPAFHFYGDTWVHDPERDLYEIIRYTWFFHTGIGLETFWDWQIKPRHKISLGSYIPVFSVGWRSGYVLFTFEQERFWDEGRLVKSLFNHPLFMSFHNFIFLNIFFDYEYLLFTSWGFKIAYRGLFQYVTSPRNRFDLQNQIHLGIFLHW